LGNKLEELAHLVCTYSLQMIIESFVSPNLCGIDFIIICNPFDSIHY